MFTQDLRSDNIEKYGFIYLTYNINTFKMYVGKCEYNRKNSWETYLGSGVYLKRAIKKYGKENFDRIILEEAYNKKELEMLEEKYLYFFNVVESKRFYNLKYTSIGGDTFTYNPNKEITRMKKSKNSKGKNNARYESDFSKETKEKIGKSNSKEIVMFGVKYVSLTEYSKLMGTSIEGISYYLNSDKYPDCYYINKQEIKKSNVGTKISINGVEYSSISEASRKIKEPEYIISKRLKSTSYENYIILSNSNNNKKKPVMIDGIRYNSLKEATECLGKSKTYIKFRLDSEDFNNYYYI